MRRGARGDGGRGDRRGRLSAGGRDRRSNGAAGSSCAVWTDRVCG